jgi:hypothetical protein
MVYTCPLCALDSECHSLSKVKEKDDILYYYTCPSKAKMYYDVEGIINHYNGVLSEIPENKEWIWIFDSLDFGLKHALQMNVGIELAKLLSSKFSNNLKKIIIINPSIYVSITHKLIMPFLNEKVRRIIEIDNISKKMEEVINDSL